jgi:hypothetical protein
MVIASKNSRTDKTLRNARERFADLGVLRLPLSAIFGFAIVGFGGALFLAYSRFSSADSMTSARSPNEVPVYSARAVPLDPEHERTAAGSVAGLRPPAPAQTIPAETERTQRAEHTQMVEPESASDALFASSARGELKGFNNFARDLSAPNIYLAVAGSNLTSEFSAQTNAPMAPDAAVDTMSVLPETSAWVCGAGLIALVGARLVRSRWRRSRSRLSRP